MIEHFAFCGKGGVGTSTVTAHVGAALAEAGFRVLHVGCTPAGENRGFLNNGRIPATVCDRIRDGGELTVESVVGRGFGGLFSLELGSPLVGAGSAEELERAFQELEQAGLMAALAPELVLYDLSGEYGRTLLRSVRRHLPLVTAFVVTTADFGALVGVNNLVTLLTDTHPEASLLLGGVIPNHVGNTFDEAFIRDFARSTSLHPLTGIPTSLLVRQSELYAKSIFEVAPHSTQSYFYRRLANQIVDVAGEASGRKSAVALTTRELREWSKMWGERLHALENGLVTDGAAI